jgi:hypothetical protein
MPDTANGYTLIDDSFYSINEVFDIPIGTGFTLQNQTTIPMKISIATTKPEVTDTNYLLYGPYPMPPITVDSGENEVWVYGSGDINIQLT